MAASSAKIIVGLNIHPKEGSMALNGNKALDLDGLTHLVDTYIKNVKVQGNGTHLGDALYLTKTSGGTTSDLTFTVDFLSGTTTLMVTADSLSDTVMWNFQATQGENWVASTAYVDAKTWDASDITSGTLPVSRGGTGMTTEPSIVVNLSSNTGVSPFGNPSMPGVMNTLNVRNGGTGKTSFTANRVLTSGTTPTGALQASAITTTELGYLDGVTSNIQTQLNGKSNTSHKHNASDITSGTLPIIRGGTGATTVTTAKANLGIGDYGKLTASSSSTTADVVKICDASWTTLVVDVYAVNGSGFTSEAVRFGSTATYIPLLESHLYVFHQVGGNRVYCLDYGTSKSTTLANITPRICSRTISGQVIPYLFAEGTADSACDVTINYQVS